MMKKTILIMAVLLVICIHSAFTWGVGIQGGADIINGGSGVGGITFKLDTVDLIFGVEIPSFNPFAIGITADYWFFDKTIVEPLGWFFGVGGFVSAFIGNNSSAVGFGARVPVGLHLFPVDFFEIYLQGAPGIQITVANGVRPSFIFPLNLGLRFWF